jgi:hypothetical protein
MTLADLERVEEAAQHADRAKLRADELIAELDAVFSLLGQSHRRDIHVSARRTRDLAKRAGQAVISLHRDLRRASP